MAGKLPRQIFSENGFDIEVIGLKRIEQSAHKWMKAYKKEWVNWLDRYEKNKYG
ncbi:hypothetical protein [Bacillus coreaensis]